jgi:hypothetical protein
MFLYVSLPIDIAQTEQRGWIHTYTGISDMSIWFMHCRRVISAACPSILTNTSISFWSCCLSADRYRHVGIIIDIPVDSETLVFSEYSVVRHHQGLCSSVTHGRFTRGGCSLAGYATNSRWTRCMLLSVLINYINTRRFCCAQLVKHDW